MKSTKSISELRVKTISSMLIKGISRDRIVQYSSEIWSIGERQTDKYIAKAREVIEHSVKKKVEYDYAKAIRRYEELFRLSMEKKDYKTALAVNKELTTLQGLHKQQVEHSGDIQFICNVPD